MTGPGEDFAVCADNFESVLQRSVAFVGFDSFRAKLESIVLGPLRDLYPTEAWRHTLPWLTRDQECRYARITAWRDTLSEADRPLISVARQYAVMRALLGLLDPKEHTVQLNLDTLAENQRKLEPQIERQDALEARERSLLLAAVSRVLPSGLNLDDLRAAQTHLASHREIRGERLQQIESELETSELKKAREIFGDAREELTNEKTAVANYAKRAIEMRLQANQRMASVERIRSAGIIDPKRAAANWCPHTLEYAQDKGCIGGKPAPDQPTAMALSELEAEANQLFAEANQAEAQRAQSESRLERLEADVVEKTNQYATLAATTRKEAIALQRDIARLEECEKRLDAYEQTAGELAAQKTSSGKIASDVEGWRADAKKLRESIDQSRKEFAAIFADVVQAVIGASVTADVKIDGDGVHLQATRLGELSGAALETVKTLSFDIAGMVSGIEGRCEHPRFLIHDGPREADMDRVIYEHFFVYAVDRIEATFVAPEKISFQYILTTTTPPPQQMQKGTDWLIAKLSSHSRDERLLKANL